MAPATSVLLMENIQDRGPDRPSGIPEDFPAVKVHKSCYDRSRSFQFYNKLSLVYYSNTFVTNTNTSVDRLYS